VKKEALVAVDQDTFKAALGQWPSGVTVVTMRSADGTWHGMTASSFSSVSLDPPLVSVCLVKTLWSHELIMESGIFGVNILASDQTELGKRFAGMRPEITDRFEGVDTLVAETGVPLFDQALAWLDCKVVNAYEGGDHTIFVGEVQAARNPRKAAPLLFHSRNWGQFADQLPEQVDVYDTGLAAAGSAKDVNVADLQLNLAVAGVPVLAEDVIVTPGDDASLTAALSGEAPERVVVAHAFAPDRHDSVLDTAEALATAGVQRVVLDDTDADANPLVVRQRLVDVSARVRPAKVGVRLRDHAGLGSANALSALKSGVTVFDTTLGGVDGVLATEDVLYLLAMLEVGTSVDRTAVIGLARQLGERWDSPLPSNTAHLD
jgi:flavin reductase (DIM6/NTAB) family NADH-FMN oxidoreductase RutF